MGVLSLSKKLNQAKVAETVTMTALVTGIAEGTVIVTMGVGAVAVVAEEIVLSVGSQGILLESVLVREGEAVVGMVVGMIGMAEVAAAAAMVRTGMEIDMGGVAGILVEVIGMAVIALVPMTVETAVKVLLEAVLELKTLDVVLCWVQAP